MIRADLMAQFKGLAREAADLLGERAPGAAAIFEEAYACADRYTIELRQQLVRARAAQRERYGDEDGITLGLTLAIESLGGEPQMPAPYVTFDVEPLTNTNVYIHPHCGEFNARWVAPHDGLDPREGDEVECPECLAMLPLVPVQAHLLGIA